eukprot:s333_g28.t1
MLLKAVKDFNGYECYRELIVSNEPQNKNRSMSLLNAIMNWPSFSNRVSLMSQVMKLEAVFSEYEKLGSALAEEIRSAVLLRCLVGQIKTWIQLQLTDTTTYGQIRESVLSYERSTTKWSETMVLGFSNTSNAPDTSAPMEVDRIKGKSKSKGKNEQKGKGKAKSDAKGKGKSEKGKSSWNNNGKGQNQWDNGKGHGWASSSSSYEHANKGKGKSKDKGKSKAEQIECFRCGKVGHRAKDCRVRVVSDRFSCNRQFSDFQCFRPVCQRQRQCSQCSVLHSWKDDKTFSVRAVSVGHDIVVDSGSDATVLPISMNYAGTPCVDQDSRLRDAQGNPIQVDSVKDICFDLQTEDGRTVTIRDTAHFSSAVNSPIISYGKLLRSGWGILPDDSGSFLVHARGFKIPMNFHNNSLTVHGHVRVIESHNDVKKLNNNVRVIHVDIPRNWQRLGSGWWEFGEDLMIFVSGAQRFVDVSKEVVVTEWPYRTTIAWSEKEGWCVLELCEKIFDMNERSKPIGQPYKSLLTIVTKNVYTVDQFGMVLSDTPGQQVEGAAQSTSASSGARASQDVQMSETVQPSSTVSQPSGNIPTTIDVTSGVESAGVTIAGVRISPTSSIALLRASCKHLEISQSGSKSKLWSRIMSHLDKLKILEETEIAQSSLRESARDPVPVQTAEKPEDER